jgi:CheY-like chemotaxis protein
VAARFKPAESDSTGPASNTGSEASNDLVKLLAAALRQADPGASKISSDKRPSWQRRKALVCTSEESREVVAKGLVAQDYDVFVAENTAEALGRMREDHIEALILESNFDPVEQGFAFVTREVKLMRPAERRRLFMIYLTPSARTMDLHAAFLHNVNLVVNSSDVERLPDALEVSIRHYNELYRDFNRAHDMPAI